jgi:hypothetical protein
MGSVVVANQRYKGIFHNITPGRLRFRIADINERSFSLKHERIIDFNNESIQSHAEAYSVTIRNILYYAKKQLVLTSYLYNVPVTGGGHKMWKGIDIVIKDAHGLRQYFTLKESENINVNLSFTKIINNVLFFAFSDNEEILCMMELDSGKYGIKQYNHQAGAIQNIWLKNHEDVEYIYTSKKDTGIISGIFKISGHNVDLAEIYERKIVGYDTFNGHSFYYNHDDVLTYRCKNDSVGYAVKKFMGKEETVYDIFCLEDGSFIIGSTKTGPDYIANFLFGEGNLMYYFYYYHAQMNEQGDNFIIKKMRTFGSRLWKLEQLVVQ